MGEILLICMVGLPRSGKSTWAHKQDVPVVNPDSIRFALHGQRYQILAEDFVWAIAKVMVRSLFLAGHDCVIVDATNTTRKRRDFWQDSGWETKFKVVSTTKELCLERAAEKGDTEIVPIIEKMADQHEDLGSDERAYLY